jgi:acyl-coenzyme A synthetase/AMP-(fatty) acid ligase
LVQITGRVDDVINVTGHRLGTAEVEDAMVRQYLGQNERFDVKY